MSGTKRSGGRKSKCETGRAARPTSRQGVVRRGPIRNTTIEDENHTRIKILRVVTPVEFSWVILGSNLLFLLHGETTKNGKDREHEWTTYNHLSV